MSVGVSIMIITFPNHSMWLTCSKMLVEGPAGTNRVEIKPATQPGESNQVILAGKTPATAAGTTPAAMLEMTTRTGELGHTMDPRAMLTMTKAGTHKARIAIVLREEMRITARAGTSRAHTVTVLSGVIRTRARTGINKAQLTIVLSEGALGAGLQDPSQPLTTPGPRAMPVVDGMAVAGERATTTIITTMVFQATCQARGTTMQGHSLESTADPTSLPKVGTNMVMATLHVPATTVAMGGTAPLHLKDHRFPVRVVTKAGQEGATEVEVRQAAGTREAEGQEEDGTRTHPTMLDLSPTRGRLTSLGTPKVRQRIGCDPEIWPLHRT